jgi:uncharacterized protein YndB with AHSA1/START domain
VLDAPLADVFDTYVDPQADRTIFGGGPDWTVEVACELRVGGLWTIAASAPGGQPAYLEVNRFTAIDRPAHLAFESVLTMPDGSKIYRDVDVTLKSDSHGRTRMAIVQMGFPNPEIANAFAGPFPSIFAHIEELAQRRRVSGTASPRGQVMGRP